MTVLRPLQSRASRQKAATEPPPAPEPLLATITAVGATVIRLHAIRGGLIRVSVGRALPTRTAGADSFIVAGSALLKPDAARQLASALSQQRPKRVEAS